MSLVRDYFRELLGAIVAGWNRFWFTPADPATLGLIRLLAGLLLFYTHLVWSLDLEGFFGPEGWLPRAAQDAAYGVENRALLAACLPRRVTEHADSEGERDEYKSAVQWLAPCRRAPRASQRRSRSSTIAASSRRSATSRSARCRRVHSA